MRTIAKIINLLFILLIITSILSYGIQAISLIMNRQYILWTMLDNNVQTGNIGKIFPYIKDFIAVLLFIILFLFFKKARKTAMIFFIITLYGILLLFGHQIYEVGYIIAGIRMFLYFFVAIMYLQIFYTDRSVFQKIFNVLKILIIIEFLITFIQVLYSGQIYNFGNGGYRFCGSFGNSIGMGNFTIAANLCIMTYSYITNNKAKNINYIYLFMNLLLSIASGTRTAIFLNLLIIYLYWNNFSLSRMKFTKKMKFTLLFIIVLLSLPFIYSFFIDRIGRGAMMVSGGIRIEIFLSFFNIDNVLDLCNLIIGNGIGFASNSAHLLEVNSSIIVDGTYTTILAQFGLFGLAILIFILMKIMKTFWKYSDKNLNIALSYFLTIILIMGSQNIFEQIAMIILIVTTYFMIKRYYIKNKESE